MGGRICGGARSVIGISSLLPRGLKFGRLFKMADELSASATLTQCTPLVPFATGKHPVAPLPTDPADKVSKS